MSPRDAMITARGAAVEFLDDAHDGQEYLVGPWILIHRPKEGDVLYWPTRDNDTSLPLLGLTRLIAASEAGWMIVTGPYGQRGPRPAAPNGGSLAARPVGASGPTGQHAVVDFIGELAGPFEQDFLVYGGYGALPRWDLEVPPGGRPAEVEQPIALSEERISRKVLEHVDAVVEAVREIRQSEEHSPIEIAFFDSVVEQLQILREHVESGEPANPSNVLRYLRFLRERLPELIDYVPVAARIVEAIDAILRIAGA